MSKRTIDVVSFESWIRSIPASFDVSLWQLGDLDVWPLFKTSLVGLGVLSRMGYRRHGLPTGGFGWQSGVLFDYFFLTRIRGAWKRPSFPPQAADELTGFILCYDSGGHARDLGGLYVSPALDVAAALLRRAGQRSVFWYESLPAGDSRLARSLHGPAYGLAGIISHAQNRANGVRTREALSRLHGFSDCCRSAAAQLDLGPKFLTFWFARQANLMLSAAELFGAIFDRCGSPEALLLLNSCVWTTAGLAAAAKKHCIPVIEIHHGAESSSAVTAPNELPHFSSFNTAPDGLISWEFVDRRDNRVFSAAPLGIQLSGLMLQGHSDDPETYYRFRELVLQQRALLAERTRGMMNAHEIVVSLQPGDDGLWLVDVARLATSTIFFWVRHHTKDSGRAPLRFPDDLVSRIEHRLASSVLLSELLARADVHLTRFSGVTLEAAAMGVPTIATEDYAADLYRQRVPKGAIRIRRAAADIAAEINAMIATKPLKQATELRDIRGMVPFVNKFRSRRERL
jgi:hypothetical protein